MGWNFITETYAVCPQITVSDLEAIKAAGFKSIINNRPDGEEAGQATAAEMEEACKAAGLDYAFNPVSPMGLTEDNIAQIKAQLENLPKPILAYCRSGTRCTVLFNAQ